MIKDLEDYSKEELVIALAEIRENYPAVFRNFIAYEIQSVADEMEKQRREAREAFVKECNLPKNT